MIKEKRSFQINEIIPKSRANGPGIRYTIWFQGCSLKCKGCINTEMHDPTNGKKMTVNELVEDIKRQLEITGITLTGGEPVDQISSLVPFLKELDSLNLNVILLTGYTILELKKKSLFPELVKCLDVIVAGRYDSGKRIARGLRGSSNKKYYFITNEISLEEIEEAPMAEIVIDGNKELISGSFIDIFTE
jgi:anaerobic ribonucleoside-triphosphate reductase activating protein